MPQIINTNLASLTAQNALNNSQNTLNTAMQQLSTGLSINSAADNAAGLAIVTGMQSQINGDTVAEQNANDGISMAQTAGSALSQITNDLQTIRQLAVQSANGTNTASNRQQINTEVQQEIAEVSRISQQTSFNGLSLLTGQLGNNVSFQIGANVGQVINMDFSQGTQSNQIGQLATTSATAATLSSAFTSGAGLTLTAGELTVNYGSGTATSVAGGNYTSASALATAINTAATTANGGTSVTIAAVSGNEIKITAGATDAVAFAGSEASTLGLSNVAAAGTATSTGVNAAVTAPGGAAPLTLATGDLTLQAGSGNAVNITGTFANSQDLVAAINAQAIPGVQAYLDSGNNMQLTSQSALTVGGTSAATLGLTAGTTSTSGSLQGGDVLTVDDSNAMMATVDAAIAQVSTLQSNLGAMQNRFNSVVANLQSGSENLSASQSSIQDTDFAAVTATLSRSQILQQSGISMLAQANSQPQLVLKLLQ
ncbi:MAG TPA: flagellin [Rhodanobacteraceae bacterium]|nr:flagellin [Rhodanobacteraceae bacterium]